MLAAALRLIWADAGWFGVDQARDLTWGARIASGEEYPTVGPAMRNRIFLGALYYYFWSVPFFFSSDPTGAYVFAGLLGVFATALTFEIGRRVAGAPAGVASALVFATMPLAVIDGRMAWAPAALPAVSASMLLALVVLVERGSRVAAVVAAILAAVALQLHVAAAPLALVVGIAILSQARTLGASGIAAATIAGAVVLLPQAWALTVPTPTSGEVGSVSVDITSGRLVDLLTAGRDAVAGLSVRPAEWPTWVGAWLAGEVAWIALVAGCALLLLVGLGSVARPAGAVVVVGMLAVAWLAVALLPFEAWHYYLDAGLVPASLVVGIVLATRFGRGGWIGLALLAAGRTALLLWWISSAQASGVVAANLDLLRLGGPDADWNARARIPTVGARSAAADALVHRLGFRPPGIWARAHGPGFSDLDTDNGYAFLRAARGEDEASDEDAADHALVAYRGEVPDDWRRGAGAPVIAGPFEILTYRPLLDYDRARLVGCGGGAPPGRPVTSPLEYGDGALRRSTWPCSKPVVSIPVRSASARGGTLRVFARLDGAGRVARVDTVPPGRARTLDESPPALGHGVEIAGADAVVVALELDGPASLDVFELR